MKTWLITGIGSGLGKATAAAAVARGDQVVGLLRDPDVAAAFEALAPGRAHGLRVDITDRDAVFAAVEQAEARTGGIDVLVNNAGQVLEAYVEEAQPDAVRALFEVNLLGPLALIQAALPHMRRRRAGRILNISSGGGIVGVPAVGLYSASKFALEGLSEALAQEVRPLGIAVTIVEPGSFRTNLLGSGRTSVAPAIADYAASAGAFRARLVAQHGSEPGDPARFGEAMMAVADSDDPPLRVALGDDAIAMALGKSASIKADVERWKSIGSGLGFPKP